MPPKAFHHAIDVAHSLGFRLRQWREREALPLRKVAERLGVSCATVSCWESGKRFPSGLHINGIVALTGLLPCQFFCPREEGCPSASCMTRCQPSGPRPGPGAPARRAPRSAPSCRPSRRASRVSEVP